MLPLGTRETVSFSLISWTTSERGGGCDALTNYRKLVASSFGGTKWVYAAYADGPSLLSILKRKSLRE
ncbi:hypothetical protein GCM10027022_12100 [Alpinimonas psychrophila]